MDSEKCWLLMYDLAYMLEPGYRSDELQQHDKRSLYEVAADLMVLHQRLVAKNTYKGSPNLIGADNALDEAQRLLRENPKATLGDLLKNLGSRLQGKDKSDAVQDPNYLIFTINALNKRFTPFGDLSQDEMSSRSVFIAQLQTRVENAKSGVEKVKLVDKENERLEQQIFDSVFEYGKFMANFSTVKVDDQGMSSGATGSQTFRSENVSPTERMGLVDTLQSMLPTNHIMYSDVREIIDGQVPPILEAVSIKLRYTKQTKIVQHVTKQVRDAGPFWNRQQIVVDKPELATDFVGFKGEKMDLHDGKRPFAATILYSTLTDKNTDFDFLYKDDHGRPGNVLSFRLEVPDILAEAIAHRVTQDPTFIRRLVLKVILDKEKGLQSNLNDQYSLGKAKTFAQTPEGKPVGLPNYDEWPKSRMIVHTELRLPQYDIYDEPPKTIPQIREELLAKSVVIS